MKNTKWVDIRIGENILTQSKNGKIYKKIQKNLLTKEVFCVIIESTKKER